MIPYNGEEVKLVWANMDQYYIKSSELLRDYTFRLKQEGLFSEAEAVVHFKLVEGDTEKDNHKPDGKTTRAFVLDAEKAFEEIDERTLNIRFRYREHTAERDLQKKLNTATEQTLADILPANWKALLLADDPTYKGKDNRDTRTILQKHLRGYTARYQFDYFIHKDLGGFLRRELDFYIKNEVLHLDDIAPDNADANAEAQSAMMRKAQESPEVADAQLALFRQSSVDQAAELLGMMPGAEQIAERERQKKLAQMPKPVVAWQGGKMVNEQRGN